MRFKRVILRAATLSALPLLLSACVSASSPPAVGPDPAVGPKRTKEQNIELGRQHKTAAELFKFLRDEAKGGKKLEWNRLPDWSGVYSRPLDRGFNFDIDQPREGPTTAKLTPDYQKKLDKRLADLKKGIEWDPISTCAPPGVPRWLTEPFLREFVVTPDQTWLINEMVNDIRRVYTDGRDHEPEEDRIPIPNGDTVGFWDGPRLIMHTNSLKSGIYQRGNPDYTDQVETVEIWEKADDKTLGAQVWVYDPPALVEPWYVYHAYGKLSDPPRIRYWDCGENKNNSVFQNKDGTTEFRDLGYQESKTEKGK
ncbi:MAG TPA: hypothetical protein VFE29_08620 [Terriglobia bacterium]|nr:hypothetical protein [Terriglobia bacterium]